MAWLIAMGKVGGQERGVSAIKGPHWASKGGMTRKQGTRQPWPAAGGET